MNEFFAYNKEWIIPLVSALAGSIIGAIGTGYVTYRFNKKHKKELEDKERLNLAKAFETELSMLWQRYMELIGRDFEISSEESPVLNGILETSQNYLVVFDNSANKLGLFEQEIVEEIIKAYINGKALIDELIEYGKITTRYKEAYNTVPVTPELKRELTEHYKYFKRRHFEIKNIFEKTTGKLKNFRN